MKNILVLSALLSLNVFTFSFASTACTQADVAAADKAWVASINAHDVTALDKLYAQNFIAFYAFAPAAITTNAERDAYFTKLYINQPKLSISPNHVTIQILNDGDAVSSGTYTSKSIKNGKEIKYLHRSTFVYQGTPDGCKIVVQHSSLSAA